MTFNVMIRAILIGLICGASAASIMGFDPLIGSLVGAIGTGVVGYGLIQEGQDA